MTNETNKDDDVVVAFDPVRALALRHAEPEKDPNKKYRYELVHFDDLRPGRTSPHIVDGIIPCSGLVAVWGPPKSGKSFWTFDLVMHVALGWRYRGRDVERGPVVYCAFEGAEGFNARAEAFRRTHDMGPTNVGGIDIETRPWFYLLASSAKLVRDHKALIESIDGQTKGPPTIVVLDTLNRSIDGSESKDQDMGAYLSAAEAIVEAFACVVIIVHHCGVDERRPRGHTSLTGNVAVQIAVRRDGANNVIAEIEAMRDGPEGATFTSELKPLDVGTDAKGKQMTSCAILPVDAAPASASKRARSRTTPNQARFLDILAEALIDVPSEHKTTINGAVAISREWLKICCKSKGWFDPKATENNNRAKVSNMINALAGKHQIGANALYVWDAR